MNRIRIVKNNESTWNFLRGLLQHNNGRLDHVPEVVEFCEELYGSGVRAPYLLSFMIDTYQEKYLRNDENESVDVLPQKINDLCIGLITKHDTIRSRYWQYVLNKFNKDLEVRRKLPLGTESTSSRFEA